MRKIWTRLTVYSISGLVVFGSLTFLLRPPLEAQAAAESVCMESGQTVRAESGVFGWHQEVDGWRYKNSDGSFATGCFAADGGSWYYFDQDGYMVRGWQEVGDDWYYFDSDGSMVTGSFLIGGKSFDFGSNGKLNKSCYDTM